MAVNFYIFVLHRHRLLKHRVEPGHVRVVPRARALRVLEPHVRAHDLALISRPMVRMVTGHKGQAGGCLVRMCVSLCLRFSDLKASLVCFFSCRRACLGSGVG